MLNQQTFDTVKKVVGGSIATSLLWGMLYIVDINEVGNGNLPLKPYRDSGGVWTVCWGHTASVDPSKTYTKEECDELLAQDIKAHLGAIRGLNDDVPETVKLGVFDFGYNKGVGAANSSTFKKRLLEEDYDGAADATLWWKYITIKKNGVTYKYDCSTPNNRVCSGVWKRLQWQSKAIGNQYETIEEAVEAAKDVYK